MTKPSVPGKAEIDIGGEFMPFSLKGLGRYVLFPAALSIVSLVLSWRRRSNDTLPFVVSFVSASFFFLTLLSQRFTEYLLRQTV